MHHNMMRRGAHSGFLFSAAIAMTLSGCLSPEETRQANAYEDQNVCADMGAQYGSSSNTDCMLQQQTRRDQESLIFLQQAHLHSEMARNAQEMRDNKPD